MAAKPESAPTKPKKPLPFSYQFIAGGIAGTSEILVMYPLDVVKTRFQLQTKKGGQQYSSIADAFRKIIAEEGAGRLYRGIIPPILMEAPKRAIKFAANEQYTTVFSNLIGLNDADASAELKLKWKSWLPVLTGVSAGATEAFVVVPFELVKIRLQDKESAGKYKNTLDCLRKIVAEEGIMAFSKGLESTLWRHAVWSGAYFGLIGKVTETLKDLKLEDSMGQMTTRFIAGVIGGSVATAVKFISSF
jgi:solute carrier family 25 (mitochondrial 2-oxodicarboxylate transporter), member 21